MSIIIAIVLGLVQGLTEFLPVSSSGHLLLLQTLFGIEEELLFGIILHIATLFAVIIVFRKKIWQLIRHPLNKTNLFLIIATAISCAMILIFKDLLESAFSPRVLPFTFLITAGLLLAITFVKPREKEVTWYTAVIAGFAQGIATMPGISRSGSTITASLATGTKREAAAEFSFLMSIPIIFASFVYEIISNPSAINSIQVIPTIFGFITALVAGIFAIKIMLKLIQNVKLYWFSIYLGILSIVSFILFWII